MLEFASDQVGLLGFASGFGMLVLASGFGMIILQSGFGMLLVFVSGAGMMDFASWGCNDRVFILG